MSGSISERSESSCRIAETAKAVVSRGSVSARVAPFPPLTLFFVGLLELLADFVVPAFET